MNNALLEFAISQGIWTALSFLLIYYIIKTQEKRDTIQDSREENYQAIILNLSQNFKIIHSDIEALKKHLIKE
ncbi:BhlA/UviB family holin-like peptide [Clostridium sp.]|uniref:BhlA/UviB family holin-like peptide n=1 Tax=Clostridium sp. TaxID=1506 RepID=UPI003994F3A3